MAETHTDTSARLVIKLLASVDIDRSDG